MKTMSFSAPGSIILSGEYGINFGKPALIAAIDKRVRVTFTPSEKKINDESWINEAVQMSQNYLTKHAILHHHESFECVFESDLPKLETLGYQSALYTVVIAGLLSWYSGQSFSQETISSLAYQLEKKLHKKSYGMRTTVSAFGGLLYFRKEFEFLRTLSLLNIKIPKIIEERLFIVKNQKGIISADEMEKAIGKRYNKDAQDTERLLQESEKITKRMVISFIKEDRNMFKDCLEKNQIVTKQLNILTAQTIKLIDDIQKMANAPYFQFQQARKGVTPEST